MHKDRFRELRQRSRASPGLCMACPVKLLLEDVFYGRDLTLTARRLRHRWTTGAFPVQ